MPGGMPLRQPHRLPPNVLDIHAPQFGLPEPAEKAPRRRRAVPAKRPAAPPSPRRLTASENRLADWMRQHLGFQYGARGVVRQYGAKAILDAVHDGLMIRQRRNLAINDRRRTLPAGVTEMVEERVVNPRIISPPAYLRHVLKGLDV